MVRKECVSDTNLNLNVIIDENFIRSADERLICNCGYDEIDYIEEIMDNNTKNEIRKIDPSYLRNRYDRLGCSMCNMKDSKNCLSGKKEDDKDENIKEKVYQMYDNPNNEDEKEDKNSEKNKEINQNGDVYVENNCKTIEKEESESKGFVEISNSTVDHTTNVIENFRTNIEYLQENEEDSIKIAIKKTIDNKEHKKDEFLKEASLVEVIIETTESSSKDDVDFPKYSGSSDEIYKSEMFESHEICDNESNELSSSIINKIKEQFQTLKLVNDLKELGYEHDSFSTQIEEDSGESIAIRPNASSDYLDNEDSDNIINEYEEEMGEFKIIKNDMNDKDYIFASSNDNLRNRILSQNKIQMKVNRFHLEDSSHIGKISTECINTIELQEESEKSNNLSLFYETKERLNKRECLKIETPNTKKFIIDSQNTQMNIEDCYKINDLRTSILIGKIEKRGGNNKYQDNYFQLRGNNFICYNGSKLRSSNDRRPIQQNYDLYLEESPEFFYTKKYILNILECRLFLVKNDTLRKNIISRMLLVCLRPEDDLIEITHEIHDIKETCGEFDIYLNSINGITKITLPVLEFALQHNDAIYFYRVKEITNFLKWIIALGVRQGKFRTPSY
ncbi:hypothetical protein SLOPH_2206 [Spraguea lophii 42_110]|uniref:Uncharacterized protein n=1 Tax=Spraguea lophii (strain 42_110) TaxID=1358809 RepID=S7W8T7_SPRLO|nr:hypothetical protein SLOPH_2206 [Spraguea lophii 42_110]